jgi:hypothetical protein
MPDPVLQFQALIDFRKSLLEVDVLCDAADTSQSDVLKYTTFNKAALLLIAGKFESFAESLLEEFVFLLNEKRMPCNCLPDVIRANHTFRALDNLGQLRHKHKQADAISLFVSMGRLWTSQEIFTEIKLDCSFAYGKHGAGELIKLFEKIGIDDVFLAIQISETVESVSSDMPVTKPVDFRGTFNSVCGMRNNILHEDESPNLTAFDTRKYRSHFESFAEKLTNYLADMLRNQRTS